MYVMSESTLTFVASLHYRKGAEVVFCIFGPALHPKNLAIIVVAQTHSTTVNEKEKMMQDIVVGSSNDSPLHIKREN